MNEQQFYVYETTNTINGKTYTGVTSHDIVNGHRYLGSGKALLRAIKKYGRDNFSIRVLFQCDSKIEALQIENNLVNEVEIHNNDNYNLVVGGGYPPNFTGRRHSEYTKKILSEKISGDLNPWFGVVGVDHPRFGKKQSVETREKCRLNATVISGEDNYCFGKLGINHPKSIPVEVDGIAYESIRIASEIIGVSESTIPTWKRRGKHSVRYLTREEYYGRK
jgi:group I intron endonuclease